MSQDLPWAPTAGQTNLRVVERSEAFVLCEDKTNLMRTLWRLNGAMVAQGGRSLTLKARVMKPERAQEPEPLETPEPPAPPKARKAPAAAPPPAQMSLF